MIEEWKPVADFPAYEISNLGRLRRLVRRGSRLERFKYLRCETMKLGYIRFAFPGKVRRLLHVIVANAFLGPAPDGMEVNHKNTNKADCAASNLEYLTHLENVRHAHAMGMVVMPKGEASSSAKLSEADVRDIRARAACGESRRNAGKRYGVTPECISAIIHRKNWKHVA